MVMATYDSHTDNPLDARAGAAPPSALRESTTPVMAAAAVNLLIGIWLFVAHWVLSYTGADPTWNDVIFGVAIALFAVIRLSGIPATRFFGILNMAIGAWLVIAAFTITDSSAAFVNNLVCGAVVLVLAGVAALAPARETLRVHTGR
jgi:SPW repeat